MKNYRNEEQISCLKQDMCKRAGREWLAYKMETPGILVVIKIFQILPVSVNILVEILYIVF